MALPPRWRKVVRDLTGHKLRTLLVVVSIAVGIFAVGVVMGARGVLVREFDTDFFSSAPPSAEFATSEFDDSLVRRIAARNDVMGVEARRDVGVRYTTDALPSTSTAGWSTAEIWALPDFKNIQVQKLTADEAIAWPPGPGEIVLEKSVLQVKQFSIGETITVETADKNRAELQEMGMVANADFTKYDGLHANCRTKYLSAEEVQYITWEMNARYYDYEWFRYNKVKRLYPRWFAKEMLRLAPFYAKRKMALALGMRKREDFFKEDLERGELCKGVI